MRKAFTLIEILVVIAIVAVLLALLIPAIQAVRAASARMECASKMKQLGLALHGYHDVYGHFPIQAPPLVYNTEGYSWMYRILPYIEQEALFKQGSWSAPLEDMSLLYATWATVVPAFVCPSDYLDMVHHRSYGSSWAQTSFLGVSGRNSWEDTDGIFGSSSVSDRDWPLPFSINYPPKMTIRIAQITRGTSNTVVVGERPPIPDTDEKWGTTGGGAWSMAWWSSSLWAVGNINLVQDETKTCPDRAYFSKGDPNSFCDLAHFWSFHSGGANWLLADGSVRFMTYDAGEKEIPEMSSIK